MRLFGQSTLDKNAHLSQTVAIVLKSFIRHGGYIQSFVGLMSQCEGMHNAVKAGNVAALERKSLAVCRKQAASSSRSLTWDTVVLTHCFKG